MALAGTPKQIQLADDVRARALRSAERHATLLRRCGRGPHAALTEELGRELAAVTSARWWCVRRDQRPTTLATALGWSFKLLDALSESYAGDLPFVRSRAAARWLAGDGTVEPDELAEERIRFSLEARAAGEEQRDKDWTR